LLHVVIDSNNLQNSFIINRCRISVVSAFSLLFHVIQNPTDSRSRYPFYLAFRTRACEGWRTM